MNKKGQFEAARKTIYWLLIVVVITIVIFAFIMILGKYKAKLVYLSPKLKAKILTQRFINTVDCFAYQDTETKRVYPGIIDWDKFSFQQLRESCYPSDDHKKIQFGFDLKNTKESFIYTSGYYNHDTFVFEYPVLLRKEGKIKPDLLRVYVQIKIP